MPRRYTEEEIQFIRDIAPGRSRQEITDEFNRRFDTDRSLQQIIGLMKKHKIRNGRDCRFGAGHVPWSKGVKMSEEQYERSKPTMFKPGNVPPNTDPIGTEKLLKDGYIWVKINNIPKAKKQVNWKQKHRLIWEEAHGPIPKGHVVIFLDGDRTNITLENLAMVPQRVLSRLNQKHLIFDDAEKTKVGIGIAEVISKIGELKSSRENKEV